MLQRQRTLLYVEDILSYAQEAISFLEGVDDESFESDRKLQLAVTYAVQVIGEAATSIPEDVRELAPSVPWRQITATRNKIVHHYFGVRLDIVANVVRKDLPQLIPEMEGLRDRLLADWSW